MTIRNTYSAEAWDKVYNAFQQVNFTSYDFDTIKESLLQYMKIYHAEHFNDFIESSELIAVLEMFAYIAELLAYRVDQASHENFITTAQRKQSVLRLARLISYRASRNIPARGLVKITSVKTTESIFDSLGNNLANVTVNWNDPNSTNWKEQFFLVMNRSLTSRFGQPSKSFQIGDVLMQLYTFNNRPSAFRNGVFPFTATGTASQIQVEVVPSDIDDNGPFERTPDLNAQHTIIYASDGRGDGSDYTGFLMFVKQGSMLRTEYEMQEPIGNRRIELDAINVNDTDVWVHRVDDNNNIIESWKRVETLNEQNIYFNDDDSTRKKYEIETLENDRIAFVFGDGNFSDAPVGKFNLWTRVSENQVLNIPKNRIVNQPMSFVYTTQTNVSHEFSLTFSLTSAIQNNAESESIEHIRQSAPSTYYAQNRMVNGQDLNTYMLRDPTILRLMAINRTFAGQPKYIEWNDASNAYQNVKLFGDDLIMYYDISADSVETRVSSKTLIDGYIEPLLQSNGVFNALNHISAHDEKSYGIISYPRRRFIEDNRLRYYDGKAGLPVTPYGRTTDSNVVERNAALNEKSAIQSALDQHWYGEPVGYTTINGIRHGIIPDPILNPSDDGKIYLSDLPRTIDGVNTYPPGDMGSGLQISGRQQYFGLRFNRFLKQFGDGYISLFNNGVEQTNPLISVPLQGLKRAENSNKPEVFTIEMASDKTTFTVVSNLRGKLPDYNLLVGGRYKLQSPDAPFDFQIVSGNTQFEAGDAFIVEGIFDAGAWTAIVRKIYSPNASDIYDPVTNPTGQVQPSIPADATKPLLVDLGVNLNGWWEVIPQEDVYTHAKLFHEGPADGPNAVQRMTFSLGDAGLINGATATAEQSYNRANSWVFLVARNDGSTGEVDSWFIYNRNMRIIAESATTKFWYTQNDSIIDSETKKPVLDKIRVLRSNLDAEGNPLHEAQIYETVGFVYDDDGNVNFNKLEVMPGGLMNFDNNTGASTSILQFDDFSANSYEFYLIDFTNEDNPTLINWVDAQGKSHEFLPCGAYSYIYGYDLEDYDTSLYDSGKLILSDGREFAFNPGDMIGAPLPGTSSTIRVGRRRRVPSVSIFTFSQSPGGDVDVQFNCNVDNGLDFMWQHFSPQAHLIDPSVTNIHDAFILTRGYYSNVMDYVRGISDILPQPPTPLDLRTSYGYLLQNKMLSDTIVLHSGKIKLLFGQKADQRLRAKFRVVKSAGATFSDERIKAEVISVINTYFDIQNWDFGEQFYATELLGLIHQRLATQIATVVLVPMYAVNSFGSLFTIDSGFDEILQSAATTDDVEIVAELTPTVLRQVV